MHKNDHEYFVYVYRNAKNQNPVYIGQGKNVSRSTQHQIESHNPEFDEWLRENKYSIEIIGPLGTKELADRIETALISCLQPAQSSKLMNKHGGVSKYRFRPFGVPSKYVERTECIVELADFKKIRRSIGDIIFVINNGQDFGDSRVGYDLLSPPTDDQIKQRIMKWWQLNLRKEHWNDSHQNSPGLLVGVFGAPGQQMIIGACEVDKNGWSDVEYSSGGLISIPLKNDFLDAFELRGKKISVEFGLKFGSFRHQQFRIFDGESFD